MREYLFKADFEIKNCLTCPVENMVVNCPCFTGEAFGSDYTDSKHPNCPLVEVPSDVRLIDADKLKDTIVRCINDAEKEYPKDDFGLVKTIYESCLYHIMNAPTV